MCWPLFGILYFVSFLVFAIILTRKIERVALLLLSLEVLVTVNVLWLFLMVPWVGQQCVFDVFHDLTRLLFITIFVYNVFMLK